MKKFPLTTFILLSLLLDPSQELMYFIHWQGNTFILISCIDIILAQGNKFILISCIDTENFPQYETIR